MNKPIHVINIGYAGRLLDPESKEVARLREYAQHFAELTAVVPTVATDFATHEIQVGNLHVIGTNSPGKLRAFFDGVWLLQRLERQHRSEQQLVATIQDPFKLALLAWFGLSQRVPRVVQVHGDNFSAAGGRVAWWWRLFGLLQLRRARVVRVVSERIKQSLTKRGVAAGSIHVLPIFFSVAHLYELATDRVYQDAAPVQLLYVGRLSEEKNVALLLRAFATARERGVNAPLPEALEVPVGCARLIIVGDGPLRADLEALSRTLGISEYVSFVGWQEDIATYYASADAFVFSSNHEGWGMVLIEAMAAGLPIVTTDVGCVGEAVRDGQEAQVVPTDDEAAFAEALLQLTTDAPLRERLGRAGTKRAYAITPTAEAYVAKWVELVHEATENSKNN